SGTVASTIGIPYRNARARTDARRRATASTATPVRTARAGRRRMKYCARKKSPAEVARSEAPTRSTRKRRRAAVGRSQKSAESPTHAAATARYDVGRIQRSALPRLRTPLATGSAVAYSEAYVKVQNQKLGKVHDR